MWPAVPNTGCADFFRVWTAFRGSGTVGGGARPGPAHQQAIFLTKHGQEGDQMDCLAPSAASLSPALLLPPAVRLQVGWGRTHCPPGKLWSRGPWVPPRSLGSDPRDPLQLQEGAHGKLWALNCISNAPFLLLSLPLALSSGAGRHA